MNTPVIVAIVIAIIVIIIVIAYMRSRTYTLSTCENADYGITCPSGNIFIDSAKYGRYDTLTCPHDTATNMCAGSDVTAQLQGLCGGKPNCTMPKSYNSAFGDGCPGISKQLIGSYHCK